MLRTDGLSRRAISATSTVRAFTLPTSPMLISASSPSGRSTSTSRVWGAPADPAYLRHATKARAFTARSLVDVFDNSQPHRRAQGDAACRRSPIAAGGALAVIGAAVMHVIVGCVRNGL